MAGRKEPRADKGPKALPETKAPRAPPVPDHKGPKALPDRRDAKAPRARWGDQWGRLGHARCGGGFVLKQCERNGYEHRAGGPWFGGELNAAV